MTFQGHLSDRVAVALSDLFSRGAASSVRSRGNTDAGKCPLAVQPKLGPDDTNGGIILIVVLARDGKDARMVP